MNLKSAVRALRAVTLTAAGLYTLAYLFVALSRLGYPFELEWMEGGILAHVQRVLSGRPIYGKPALEFVSFFYPPLYYWAGALFSRLLGPGFVPLRLLSLLSSLGAAALIFGMVQRETGSRFGAAVAAGLFAASFKACGFWLDLARADSLFLLLFLGGVYLVRFGATHRSQAAAGVLFGAAFLAKQSALVIAAPVMLHAVLFRRPRGYLRVAVAFAVMAGSMWWLNHASGGWFWYYCFAVPAHHPIESARIGLFWTHDVLRLFGAAFALSLLVVAARTARPFAWSRQFHLFLLAGALASSWSVRTEVGAETNNVIPLYAVLAILAGLGVSELGEFFARRSERAAATAGACACALVLIQFALLAYNPLNQIPRAEDKAAGEALVRRLAAIPGDVFMPHHGYLAIRAGKSAQAHTLAIDNILLDDRGPARMDLEREMAEALRERRFAAVVLESDRRYGRTVLKSYEVRERLFPEGDLFFPVTGARLRPEWLCLPRSGS